MCYWLILGCLLLFIYRDLVGYFLLNVLERKWGWEYKYFDHVYVSVGSAEIIMISEVNTLLNNSLNPSLCHIRSVLLSSCKSCCKTWFQVHPLEYKPLCKVCSASCPPILSDWIHCCPNFSVELLIFYPWANYNELEITKITKQKYNSEYHAYASLASFNMHQNIMD